MATKPAFSIEDVKGMDVDALKLEIQELEGKLELQTRDLQKEIDARKELLKVVEILKNGKPARKPWTRKAKPEAPPPASSAHAAETGSEPARRGRPTTADRIHEILRNRGRLSVSELAKFVAITEDNAKFNLENDDRFATDNSGRWYLAPKR